MSADVTVADDGFAGAGGWSVALRERGIHDRGIECMAAARATREAAGFATVHDDVWTHRPDGTAPLRVDSPPCQTFSDAGKGAGRKALDDVLRGIRDGYVQDLDHLRFLGEEVGDERTALVLLPLHFAAGRYGYEMVAWEQVPSVLPVWEACAEYLRARGWWAWTGYVYSEQHGVAQTRKRAALVASKRGPVGPPVATHSRYHPRSPERLDDGVKPWVSMAEALGAHDLAGHMRSNYGTGGDPAARGERDLTEPAPTVTSKVDRNKWVLQVNAQENATIRDEDQPAPTLTAGHSSGEMRWLPGWAHRRPSTTIVGSFKPEVVAAPGYRTTVSRQNAPDSVQVTAAEAGVLQSFPADYPWQGAKGKQYLQVGNAIPPLMAGALLDVLLASGGAR